MKRLFFAALLGSVATLPARAADDPAYGTTHTNTPSAGDTSNLVPNTKWVQSLVQSTAGLSALNSATGGGSTNDATALGTAAATAQAAGQVFVLPKPSASYLLNSDVKPASGDLFVTLSPSYAQSGAGLLRFDNQVPDQHSPVLAFQLLSKSYGSAFDGYASGNVFQFGSVVTNNNTAGTPVVSVFGEGIANTALAGTLNNSAWGLNAVGVAAVASSNAFASELDCVALDAAITGCVGASINAAGTNKSTRAVDIRANNDNAGWQYGLNFTGGTHEPVVHSLIVSNGAINPENFVNFLSAKATLAEVNMPSFQVGASKNSPVSRWRASAGTTATGSPSNAAIMDVVTASGVSTTDADGAVKALGSGAVWVTDANGTIAKFQGLGSAIANQIITVPAAASGVPSFGFVGSDTNVDGNIFVQGTGKLTFTNTNGNTLQLRDSGGATANYPFLDGGVTTADVILGADGTDTNIAIDVKGKGNGAVLLKNTNGISARFLASAASTVSRWEFNATASGTIPSVSIAGTVQDMNINAGASNFVEFGGAGSWSANGAVATTMTSLGPTGSHTTIQEWLTVKNASGVVRYVPAY